MRNEEFWNRRETSVDSKGEERTACRTDGKNGLRLWPKMACGYEPNRIETLETWFWGRYRHYLNLPVRTNTQWQCYGHQNDEFCSAKHEACLEPVFPPMIVNQVYHSLSLCFLFWWSNSLQPDTSFRVQTYPGLRGSSRGRIPNVIELRGHELQYEVSFSWLEQNDPLSYSKLSLSFVIHLYSPASHQQHPMLNRKGIHVLIMSK
jgi:hypothetical protein